MADTSFQQKHTLIEDAQGLLLGVFVSGLGVHILSHIGLMTGQTAGLAILLAYATGWSFGVAFFIINLPFYALAYRRLGVAFTVKSALCVTLLSVTTEILPHVFKLGDIHPAVGVLAFGALVGLGLLAVFRHNGSLGGLGVVALFVQDRWGVRAGYVQLAADTVLFAVALALFPTRLVAWSLLGAVVVNLIIATNHRPDRYTGR